MFLNSVSYRHMCEESFAGASTPLPWLDYKENKSFPYLSAMVYILKR